jgi:hypothetical protein
MPKATGFSALAALTTFTAKKWFTKSFVDLVEDISRLYGKRSEVASGLLLSDAGTQSAVRCDFAYSTGSVYMNGGLVDIAGATKDCLAGGTTADPVIGGIMSDGSAEAISLATDAHAFITIIATNSTGSAAVTANNAVKLVAVISGTGASPTATEHLTTAQINAALKASAGKAAGHDHSHASVVWCHVGQFQLDENSGSPNLISSVENRNNRLGI